MKDIMKVIKDRTKPINEKINPVYYTLCCNKLVNSLASQYLASVCKLKRINEVSAHQFQLDLEELKNQLNSLIGG